MTRNHKSNPPKTSPVMDSRRSVTAHNEAASVGHGIGSRRKTINDPKNGEDFDGGTGRAPGANGPAETG